MTSPIPRSGMSRKPAACHYAFIHYISNYALADNAAIIYVIMQF